ncbi:MAG: YhcH/YjgK/YiaL family protein, partial [Candidatus Ornithospirochaeta sp.]|nr:YhcH/YjgK/YiaL family protein [Candidatus Ornithospirochaeta sp.]
DSISNLGKYGIGFLEPLLSFLESNDLADMETGFHSIDGKKLTVSIVERELASVPEVWEVHRKYIDVHLVLSGDERIALADESELELAEPYSEDKDAALYRGKIGKGTYADVAEGSAMVIMPGEIHMPNIPLSKGVSRKAIFKILIEDWI